MRTLHSYILLFLVLLFSVPGCLDYRETIEVKPDGSVEIRIYAAVVQAAMPMLRNRPELRDLLMIPSGAQNAQDHLPGGIKVKYWFVTAAEGLRIFDLAVTVPNLAAFESNMGTFLGDQAFDLYLDEDGLYQYRRQVPPSRDPGEQLGPVRMFNAKMRDSNLEFHLKVPGTIVDSNGKQFAPNHVRWKTNLVGIRDQGMQMEATVKPPGVWELYPWLAPSLAAVLGLLLVWSVLRRRRMKTS